MSLSSNGSLWLSELLCCSEPYQHKKNQVSDLILNSVAMKLTDSELQLLVLFVLKRQMPSVVVNFIVSCMLSSSKSTIHHVSLASSLVECYLPMQLLKLRLCCGRRARASEVVFVPSWLCFVFGVENMTTRSCI